MPMRPPTRDEAVQVVYVVINSFIIGLLPTLRFSERMGRWIHAGINGRRMGLSLHRIPHLTCCTFDAGCRRCWEGESIRSRMIQTR